jgi:hypothetical protein
MRAARVPTVLQREGEKSGGGGMGAAVGGGVVRGAWVGLAEEGPSK